ncbi:UNVERIFIED_CONTAM: hypothetical protein PYX00_009730 [Menopon gallinae]|uniref:Odorant receptor n=1 Tax=Menopon gallinae TaxID=328185 RepID=A0AAW2HC79_9NEOP
MVGDHADFFKYRVKLLRAIGCWSRKDGGWAYTVASSATLINSFVGVSLSFYTLILFVALQKDIETISSQMITFIIAFQVFTKSGLTVLKCRQIQGLIDELNDSFRRTFLRNQTDREVIRKCSRYDVKLAIFFSVFSTFVTVANILKPLIVTLSESGTQFNETEKKYGEFPSRYPFELEANTFWFWFWFCQQVMVVVPGGIASWISDSLFCAFLYYICGYIDILMNNIRNAGEELNVRKVARAHTRIIRFSEKVIITFGPLMVIQLLLAAITICCLLFQFFSVSGELVQYSRPISYLTLKFIQIYIMCWHGQLLLDKSMQIGEVLYFCPWYGKSKIKASDLQILMIRTRAPIRVVYGAIFQLSAGTFGQILNAAYGYFAMMSKMKQK